MTQVNDNWSAGDAHENYMGRWSRALAHVFVKWLSPPDRARWLDIGCGTGALTRAICELASPEWVLACDPSESFINHARAALPDGRASFVVAAAEDLPKPKDEVDYAVLGLVLNFLSDPEHSVGMLCETVRRGGMIAAYVWDYQGRMQFLRRFWDAAVEIDPAAADLDEGRRFPICHPSRLYSLLSGAGLQEVTGGPLEIATRFQSFEDFWTPFVRGTGPAPSYVSSLSGEHRDALRERLSRSLTTESDGSIHLDARAWAIKGVAPK